MLPSGEFILVVAVSIYGAPAEEAEVHKCECAFWSQSSYNISLYLLLIV
jgi:hypothetical protein